MSRRLTTAEILAQIPAARTRGAQERKAGLRATSARYDRRGARLVLELTNGFLFGIPVATLPRLAQATATQLADIELSPEGGALHFDALDADYSVPGLVLSVTAREVGRQGGLVRSAAKTRAAKANGAKGGRPRKVPVVA